MKVIIDIPADFEKEWNKDRFRETLRRLIADAHIMAGNYEKETATMLIDIFQDAAQ